MAAGGGGALGPSHGPQKGKSRVSQTGGRGGSRRLRLKSLPLAAVVAWRREPAMTSARPIDPATRIGHVHLKVADLAPLGEAISGLSNPASRARANRHQWRRVLRPLPS